MLVGGKPTPGVSQSSIGGRHVVNDTHSGKTHRVAVLVCEAFNGPKPFAEAVCMHLDEDCRNDRPENLAWGRQSENLNAPNYIQGARERESFKRKLTDSDCQRIGFMLSQGASVTSVARRFSVSRGFVSNLKAGRGGPRSAMVIASMREGAA